ncbi:MAG: cobalt ECF transporter T component CbiQ [Spirochaetaceae bacterium]|jgi:cobalt/nickel transport system permease protein|nr:cobalt ECF transporter T component CbiQ [Spirochaetaceae bacterium]
MTELRRAAAGITALEEYAGRPSPLGRAHPLVKLLATAVYIVCVTSFPSTNLSGLVPYAFYPALLAPLSNVPAPALVKRLVPVLPFALMGGIANLFFMKEPAFVFGSVIISEGAVSFIVIMLKAVFCVVSVLILIGSTPFQVICAELRRLHVPAAFCVQLVLMYRYIAVLLGEASAMYTAYMLRSAEKAVRFKDMGSFLGRLAIRSIDKAARVYNAMKCRGARGIFYAPRRPLKAPDYLYGLLVSGLCVFFRFFNLPVFLGSLFHA